MRKGIFLIALIVYSLTSCQEKANTLNSNAKSVINKKSDNKSNIKNTDFLKNLQDICVEDDGVFKNCDALFTKDGSSLFFIIIPKIGANNWYNKQTENISGEIYEVNNILIDKVKNNKSLSNEFDIWLFFIDKKYTEFVGMDSPYNFKTTRTTDLFYLNSNNNWEKLESFKVLNEKDDKSETKWRSNFIDKIINQSNSKNVLRKMSNNWKGKYSFEKSNRDKLKTSFKITINNLNDINILYTSDGETPESYNGIVGKMIDKNKIEIVFNKKYDEMGVIYLQNDKNDYIISGTAISTINPGNDEYPLKKNE